MRTASFLASIAIVLTAMLVVPMPYERTVPGSARPVEDLVTVGVETDAVNGDLALLTVRDRDAHMFDLIVAAVRPGQQLVPVAETLPAGIDERTMREILAQQFANSFTTAVAVAAETAGYRIDVETEVVTTQVLPGGPADGLLRSGDIILAIDGTAVDSSSALVEQLQRSGEGDRVTLRVLRDGEERTVTVQLGILPETGQPGLGIIPSTLTAPVELPFDVQLAESNIIGPSAGLMIAVTVADLLLDEDLADGRRVSGTGTIDGTGAVGTIGSIEMKVEAAVSAGSDLMLVPAEQAEVAQTTADGRIEVIGVATLDDALAALRGEAVAAP